LFTIHEGRIWKGARLTGGKLGGLDLTMVFAVLDFATNTFQYQRFCSKVEEDGQGSQLLDQETNWRKNETKD
jgi:hypothetical protein